MQERILSAWYEGRWWLYLLLPVSWLLSMLARIRRNRLSRRSAPLAAPVIVVGNIAIGGTGKTPLIIALVKHLQQRGYRPGVVSRGYGGRAPHYPYSVTADSSPAYSGDEPLLIATATGCPVMVGSDRVISASQLIEKFDCDVILSDDGLQHYKLSRQFEICVVDGQRQMGNGFCIPAGPLREPPARLREVDVVVVNGSQPLSIPGVTYHSMQLRPDVWQHVAGIQADKPLPFIADKAQSKRLLAVTGIGNPRRFFNTLNDLTLMPETRSYPDHHPFTEVDLQYARGRCLLMTAKDAVKCRVFADEDWWSLVVTSHLEAPFWERLDAFLEKQV